jgi:beta-galactosidase
MLNHFRCLFSDSEALGAGRMPVRAHFDHFETEEQAREALWRDGNARRRLSLAGAWKFYYTDGPASIGDEMFDPDYDDIGWSTIAVPGCWDMQGYDYPHYTNVQMPYPELPPQVPERNPTGLYRTRFILPDEWRCKRVVIHFDGVESCFALYVNGRVAGFGKDSRRVSEFDLTGFLHPGENLLAIMVTKWSDSNYIEDQDQWWHGGIVRDVHLFATDREVHLADIFAIATLSGDSLDGILTCEVLTGFDRMIAETENFRVAVRLYDRRNRLIKGFPQYACPGRRRFRQSDYSRLPCRITVTIPRIEPWSAERPNRYMLTVSLLDGDDCERAAAALWIGFRKVEIKERQLLINGAPVRIVGINRHEHDPRTGRTMTTAAMRRDLEIMKRFNINAIRTSHYPDVPEFYDLCDEYGFYVWDEANVETHAYYWDLTCNPVWTAAFAGRMSSMIERDKNHPSVVVWSLGNESGVGANHAAMAGYARFRDPSRPLHYEGACTAMFNPDGTVNPNALRELTDLVPPMYPSLEKVEKWSKCATEDSRPFIMCEYSHAMGNSNGSLSDYFALFDRCEGLQGGFIWEWCEHGILRKLPDGREAYAYGGDLGDAPHDGNFVCDGLVGPDRELHAALYEYKYLGQPVRFHAVDPANGVFKIENRRYFTPLDDLYCEITVEVDGRQVSRARHQMPKLEPGCGKTALLHGELPDLRSCTGREACITLRARLKKATGYAPANYEVAIEQFPLYAHLRAPAQPRSTAAPAVVRAEGAMIADYGGMQLVIRQRERRLELADAAGRMLIDDLFAGHFFRPPTDNDLFTLLPQRHRGQGGYRWIELGLDKLKGKTTVFLCDEAAGRVIADSLYHAPGAAAPIAVRQELDFSTPQLQLVMYCEIPECFVDLPRVGLQWRLDERFTEVEFFGRGPHENYCDRKAGAMLGRYRFSVDELEEPYVMPQASGNRTGVRELCLRCGDGATLRVIPDLPMEFSLQRHSDAEIFAAAHREELPERKSLLLNLDARQRGIGTASCGPDTLAEYRLSSGCCRFALELTYQPQSIAKGNKPC